MTLYINGDRNASTGWEGYDYAVNRGEKGSVSKYENGNWVNVGSAEIKVDAVLENSSKLIELSEKDGVLKLKYNRRNNIPNEH